MVNIKKHTISFVQAVHAFSEPDIETIRIISARKAKKHELEVLYGNG